MSYSSKLTAHFAELANNAVMPGSFAGEDVRFSPEFEALETELGKAQSIHASGQVDWLKVLEGSEALLREQSKDLRVGAWLTWALYQREAGTVGAIVNQVKQVATQLFTPGEPVESEKDASKALRAQQEQGRQLCVWWQRQKATDLRALRLNRTLLWLAIEAMPERNADNVTALRSLLPDKLKSYRERFEQGAYPFHLGPVKPPGGFQR